MEDVFREILELSITGGGIILIIIFIRLFFRKIPGIFSYVSWIIPAIKLLIPVTFTGIWGLVPDKIMEGHQVLQVVERHQEILNKTAPVMPEGIIKSRAADMPVVHGVFYWIAFIWLAGFIFLLCCGIISYVKLWHKLQVSINLEENIYLADFIPAGFVMGIFNPRIYISSALPEEERRYVVLHERVHIKRHDYIFMPVAYILLCIHWFNPVVWLGFSKFVQDMEMSCDERVIKEAGRKNRKNYAGILIQMAGRKTCPGMTAMFYGSNIKRRVKNMMKNKRNSKKVKIIAGATLLATAVLLVPDFTKTNNKVQAEQKISFITAENGTREKAKKVTEPGLIYTKEKMMYFDGEKHTYPGYLCYYEINNPGYCDYSVQYLEKLFQKVADKWSEDIPLAADNMVMYFDQKKSDKLAKKNSCDIVIQADFEIPENNDETIFKPGIYKKYNYYLSKNKDGKWIVK